MRFGEIIGPFVFVASGMAVPFFCLLFAWLSPTGRERPRILRQSLPRFALWIASASLLLASVSLVRVQMIAPRVPSPFWIALNWVSAACWMLVLLLALFGKGRPRVSLFIWSIVFPIFAALLFGTAYTY